MADYTITFDGGCLGNQRPGDQPSYGSFHIRDRQGSVLHHVSKQPYGPGTNNTAEYRAVIDALKTLRATLGAGAKEATLDITGDSMLVIQQLSGKWKAKDARLARLRDEAQALMREFGRVQLKQQPRAKSVAILGH
ncbi:MAG: ribonuclease HI family protein [Chloroflexi bacterium]|nr:ribonuclease HI family protein [Chloroflexota bacterium]